VADQDKEKTPAGALALSGAAPKELGDDVEEDALFKLQMALANFALGSWKIFAGILGAVLVGSLLYGLWKGHVDEQQANWQDAIAAAERKLPEADPIQKMLGTAPSDPAELEKITAVATTLEGVAKEASGPAKSYAWLRAAQVWQTAGKSEEANKAWTEGAATGAEGVLGWSLTVGAATARLSAGDTDGAIALYRGVVDKQEGSLSEQALYIIGTTYAEAGRFDDAAKAFSEFETKFPESALKPSVEAAKAAAAKSG
jgi:tetratricopeptide (TPR) repeat protein